VAGRAPHDGRGRRNHSCRFCREGDQRLNYARAPIASSASLTKDC
jgi:hypothetical protein